MPWSYEGGFEETSVELSMTQATDTARVLRIKSTLDVQEAKSVTFHASSNKGITVRRYQ